MPEDMSPEEREILGLTDAAGEEVRLHPILSNAEVLKARAAARSKLEKERRAAAMADVEARELQRLRNEEGLTSGITDEDELVWVTIDLPEWCPAIFVNSEPFWHGHSYQVPKHRQRSLAEQQQASWRAHDQTEGKSIAQMMRNKRGTTLNGKSGVVVNAPARLDA